MKTFPSILAAVLVVSAALTISLRAITRSCELSQSPSGDAFPNKSVVIYVADFDIDVLRARDEKSSATPNTPSSATDNSATVSPAAPAPSASQNAAGTSPPSSPDAKKLDGQKVEISQSEASRRDAQKTDPQRDNSPAAQAARLVELTSTTLVKALEQAGYVAHRLRDGGSRPDDGVVIRGVFAQADANAGLRRVVFGGDITDPKMVLFVGVGNLARPDQAVYQPVGSKSADGRLGPVISISVYAPVSRYDMDRDASEELLKKTATRIVGDVTKLLNANPLSVNQ